MSNIDRLGQYDGSEIAIIGMACRVPGANSPRAFWDNLRNGIESITFLSDEELLASGVDPNLLANPNYVRAAAVVEGFDQFDAQFFGFTPAEAETMDPQQRLLLECSWEALESAGYTPDGFQYPVGVYAGAKTNTYSLNIFSNQDYLQNQDGLLISLGSDLAFLGTRISYKLNLKGPSYTVQTACSTSLVAVHLACQSLLSAECHMALAGGSAITVPHRAGYLYQEGSMLSPDGHCRAFDAEARGTVFGNGVGMVVLKRLEDALADGDTILAVIKGSAINNDGSLKASFTAPSVDGQTEVILDALACAGVDAETISYIETHGTGTSLGDPIEILALSNAFRASTTKTGFCAIGSVKTNIGHLDAAAGVIGLIKTVLALQNQQIPPSLHFSQPNPQIDFAASPFVVNTTLREWPRTKHPRRAGVSSFGFGGTNAHVILEEAPPAAPSVAPGHPAQLLLLSARTPSALAAACANLADHLAQHPELALADVAATLQVGRRAFRQRRALVVTDHAQAIAALRSDDPQALSAPDALPQRPVVFLFPGQGAQYVGMGQDLYHNLPRFRAVVDQCAALLTPQIGLDLRSLLYPSDDPTAAAARLAETDLGQVALFVVSYALAQQWIAWGVQPAAMIGHSLGEYVAACLAGVFSLEAALRLVVQRGKLMQAQPRGSMLAVSLPAAVLAARLPSEVTVAVETSPEGCVVAGPSDAVAALAAALTEEGVAHQPVATTHAFHSALMDGAVAGLTTAAATTPLAAPTIPYISTVSGTWITAAEATDAQYWGRQLRAPVRLATGLATVASMAGAILLEVGPGQAMSSLARRQRGSDQVVVASMRHRADARDDVVLLLEALGQFWVAGGTVDWARFHADQPRRRVPLPTYPFERNRYWVEPHTGRTGRTRPATGKHPDLAEWFFVPSWQQKLVPPAATAARLASTEGNWLVLMDEQGLGATLVARLRAAGATVVAVQAGSSYAASGTGHYVVAPAAVADYRQLLQTLQAQGQLPSQILHLWSLTADQKPLEGVPLHQRGYESLIALAQALDAEKIINPYGSTEPLHIHVISNMLYDISGIEMTQPEKATILGPCKVIPQEYQQVVCHCIDLGVTNVSDTQRERLADIILAEVLENSADLCIAYRGKQRLVQTYAPVPLRQEAIPARQLRERGVYFITGGLGGVALLLAQHLAKTVQARLVLVGRAQLPPRTAWEDWLASHAADDEMSMRIRKVQDLEALGAEVLVLAADVADEAQMRVAVEQALRHFGTIHGVLHAAGVTKGKSIFCPVRELEKIDSLEQFRPKVVGTQILARVLEGQELDFCLLFSSNAATLGGIGFTAYAAANLFLDAFAIYQSKITNVPWISSNWDVWTVEPGLSHAPRQTSVDKYTMTMEEGIEAFTRLVNLVTVPQIVIATGDLEERLAIWIRQKTTRYDGALKNSSASSSPLHPRPRLTTAYTAPRNETEEIITEIWQQILGVEQIGIHDNFFDLGGQSLLAVQLVGRLATIFDISISPRSLYETLTIAEQAELVEDILLAEVEALSEEEVSQQLSYASISEDDEVD